MGGLFNQSHRVPITEQPAIDLDEIKSGIRKLVERYSGEELIAQLAAFCVENTVEVIMTRHQSVHAWQAPKFDEGEISLLSDMAKANDQARGLPEE